ncbi:MAG TPA: AMP-binding protein [Candidatus Dietzia intestinipullorum]|nr:AMP-binding protein [Candidatus Dietzia intestinipullorum]
MSHNPDMNQADVFEAVADAVPDYKALTMDGRTLSFRDLDEESTRMGHLLQAAGVEPGEHVALHMKNSIEHMCALIGSLKVRAGAININYRYTVKELEYLYNDSDCVATMVDAEFGEAVAEVLPGAPGIRAVLCVGDAPTALVEACREREVALHAVDTEWPSQSPERDFGPRSGDDTMVVYTGGTTGYPKGVQWRAADYFYACLSGGNPYGEARTSPQEVAEHTEGGAFFNVVMSAPLMHGAGTFTVFTFLNLGGHLIMQRDFDPLEVVRSVEREKAGMLVFVGDGMAVPIIDTMVENKDTMDFSSLFAVSSGGGIWSKASRDKLLGLLPDVIVRDNFGASESGNDGELTMNESGEVRLAPGPRLRVVREDFSTVEPGSDEIGFLARAGHVPLGYYNDPEKTARTFPIIDGVRMSILGDMARVDEDGSIIFLGRGSGTINTAGEKVFPEEVEQALKSHPAVFDAVVAGAPDERYGQMVAAVVQYRDGEEEPTDDELRTFLRESLAGYKLPKRIVGVPEIKRSPAGKADYRWAKDQVAAG